MKIVPNTSYFLSLISVNTASIASNLINILQNAVDINSNASNILTNQTNITTNSGLIATNTTNISTNISGIATNVSGIATNVSNIALKLNLTGGTLSGFLFTHSTAPTADYHVANKKYVDDKITGDAFNMIGALNAQWIPLAPLNVSSYGSGTRCSGLTGYIYGDSGTVFWVSGILTLPTIKGSKHLYIAKSKIAYLKSTYSTDYIDTIRLIGHKYSSGVSGTTLDENTTNYTIVQEIVDNFTDIDVSAYDYVSLNVLVRTSNPDSSELNVPLLKCYYA